MSLYKRLENAEARAARLTTPPAFVLPDDPQARALAERFEAHIAALPAPVTMRSILADPEATRTANDYARRLAELNNANCVHCKYI
jgi:hypothetical protein